MKNNISIPKISEDMPSAMPLAAIPERVDAYFY